jgi:hypothetical protein
MHNKVKGKVCPVNTMAGIGCRGITPLSLNSDTRRRWEGQLRSPVALPQGKNLNTNKIGDRTSLRATGFIMRTALRQILLVCQIY